MRVTGTVPAHAAGYGVVLYVRFRPDARLPQIIDGYTLVGSKGLESPEETVDDLDDVRWLDHQIMDSADEAEEAIRTALTECRLQHLCHRESGGFYRPVAVEVLSLEIDQRKPHRRFRATNVIEVREINLQRKRVRVTV